MKPSLLLLAKAPVPGRVKTRLCPPCTPAQAAAVAEAALRDTIGVLDRTEAPHRTLVVSGEFPAPAGWRTIAQQGDGLGERIWRAFTEASDGPALLVGMDTPQLTPRLLRGLGGRLDGADAVLAPASDGGWWALALRDPSHAAALAAVPTSTSTTGRLTAAALRAAGLRVAIGPVLSDVDTARDARRVAFRVPRSRFAAAVAEHVR